MKSPPCRQSFEAFRTRPYFNALDGLRAVSILMVLFHHVTKYPARDFLHTLQENGRYGVAFFFVISGFLIGTLLLREEEKTGRIDLWKFYGRRALRLLPLYYVALLLQAVLVFVLHQYTPENQQLFRDKLPAYLFYYSNWLATATQGPFFQAWSLAVEEQFYLVFGLLLFFTGRRLVIGAALAALLVKFSVYSVFGNVDVGSTLWRVVFSYQEPILFGVLAAFALNCRPYYEFFARWLGHAWMPAGLGAGTVGWIILHPMQTQSSWDAQLLYLLMTLILIGLVVRATTPVLGGRFMVHVGKISYGIYLLHMFVISAVKKLPGGTAPVFCFLVSAVAVIAVASLVYQFFEHPIIAFYKRRLSPLNSVSVAAASSESVSHRQLQSNPSPVLRPPSPHPMGRGAG
ncbi:MAG TPA: acyltransferase [Verrucomicrobiae bacterium]|nr:acyltransferase [Verrucomicrobiae bacterium]